MHGCINRIWYIHSTEYYSVIKRQNIYTQNHLDGSPENYTDERDSQKIIYYIVDVLLHFKITKLENYKLK